MFMLGEGSNEGIEMAIASPAIELFVAGFITFFATGLDDTIAYAPFMQTKRAKLLVSSGIVTATVLDIIIAIFLSSLVRQLPYPHLIGGGGLFALGLWIVLHGDSAARRERIESEMEDAKEHGSLRRDVRLFGIGFVTFFFTGLDDTIAYSFLLTTQAAIIGFSAGILVATGVDLLLVFFLADRLRKLPHTRLIGGAALMALGLLLAFQIL